MGVLSSIKKKLQRKPSASADSGIEEIKDRVNYHPKAPQNLMDAVRQSYKDMEKFRTTHKKIMEEFCGDLYCDNKKVPVILNMIHQFVMTHKHLLSSQTPQVIMEPMYRELTAHAYKQEIALNRIMDEVDFGTAAGRAVVNAFFTFGVTYCGIGDSQDEVEIDGHLYDPGQPFISSVNINNFVIDMQAESIETIDYIGDRLLKPLSWIKENREKKDDNFDSGDGSVRTEFKPEDRITGVQEKPEYRADKSAWVWRIWMPKHNALLWFVEGESEPFMVEDWEGPERGPYEVLQFIEVPGEPLGMSPTMVLYHIHMGGNNLTRKLMDQAKRQKTLSICEKGDGQDAQTINNANDGDAIALTNTGSVTEHSYGGPNMSNHNMTMWLGDMFNMYGGNIHAIAGLGPQSETFKQDKLISDAANIPVENMADMVTNYYERLVGRLAWYHWYTQPLDIDISMPVTDEISVPTVITPEDREGDWLDYNFKIVPYSMRKESPQEKAQKLMGIWNEMVMPNAEMAMQLGYVPNFEEFGSQVCKLLNIDFNALFKRQDGQPGGMQKPGMVPMPSRDGAPAFKQSHTVNERINRSGTTAKGMNAKYLEANAASMSQAQTQVS